MMAETANQEVASVSNGVANEGCPVAEVDLVANSTHLITVEPPQETSRKRRRRPPMQDGVTCLFYGDSHHPFAVRAGKTYHQFRFSVNTRALFNKEDYDSYARDNKVAICRLSRSHSLTSTRADISIYREGEMIASLKGTKMIKKVISTKQADVRPFIHCRRYDVLQNSFSPVPDQPLTFKIMLRDLCVPTKVAADVNRVELHKLVTYDKIESRFAADMAKYMGEMACEDTDKHSDLKLICQDETIKCHKFILSARSPVLQMILSNNSKEAKTGVIEIEDSDPASLRQFVRFLYSEEISQTNNIDNLAALLHLADKYDVDTLAKACSQKLQSKMDRDNVCHILRLARMYRLDMEEAAKEYVAEQVKDVIKTDSWNELLISDPTIAKEIIMKIMK